MNRFGWGVIVTFLAVATLALCSRAGGSLGHATDRPSSGLPPAREDIVLVIPVEGVTARRLIDTWGQTRENGARWHQAIDIPAPGGTPVRAAMAGRVEKLFVSERGGITVYIRSEDGGWLTYYAHLSAYAPGLREGMAVAQGQRIAFVGDTGNAGAGNTHLHFALHRMAPGERWWQGTPVNPYPILAGNAAAR